MQVWVAFAVGMFLGGMLGVVVMCLMVMASRTSRSQEEEQMDCRKCGREMDIDAERSELICLGCGLDYAPVSKAQSHPVMTEREKFDYRAQVWAKLNGGTA